MRFANKDGLPVEDIKTLPLDKLKSLKDIASERLREIGFEYNQQEILVNTLQKAIDAKQEEYDREEGISEKTVE